MCMCVNDRILPYFDTLCATGTKLIIRSTKIILYCYGGVPQGK